MRTNSKQVKTAIRQYLLDSINCEGWDEHQDGDIHTDLMIIICEFRSAAIFPNNLHRFKHNYQLIFTDWMQGLPSCLSIEFTNYGILEKMAEFGLPLPANKDEDQGISLYYNLIFRAFNDLLKEYKLKLI